MTAMVSPALLWLRETGVQSLGLGSPFCPWYLLPAAALSAFWLGRTQGWGWRRILTYTRQLWSDNRSSIRSDGLWAAFQLIFLRQPVAWLHVVLFEWSYDRLLQIGGDELGVFTADRLWEGLLATVVTMLAIDLAAYAAHRALHSSAILWKVHRVHHGARFLSPLSTLRQHPLEPFLLTAARGLAAGVSLGLLHLFWPNCTPVWTMGGMGLGFFIYMFTVNLHHAPIPVRYPALLRAVLISPHIHHIHHSRATEHHGKNFGVVFSFWDRMLGSYLDQDIGLGELKFGLEAEGSQVPGNEGPAST